MRRARACVQSMCKRGRKRGVRKEERGTKLRVNHHKPSHTETVLSLSLFHTLSLCLARGSLPLLHLYLCDAERCGNGKDRLGEGDEGLGAVAQARVAVGDGLAAPALPRHCRWCEAKRSRRGAKGEREAREESEEKREEGSGSFNSLTLPLSTFVVKREAD